MARDTEGRRERCMEFPREEGCHKVNDILSDPMWTSYRGSHFLTECLDDSEIHRLETNMSIMNNFNPMVMRSTIKRIIFSFSVYIFFTYYSFPMFFTSIFLQAI